MLFPNNSTFNTIVHNWSYSILIKKKIPFNLGYVWLGEKLEEWKKEFFLCLVQEMRKDGKGRGWRFST